MNHSEVNVLHRSKFSISWITLFLVPVLDGVCAVTVMWGKKYLEKLKMIFCVKIYSVVNDEVQGVIREKCLFFQDMAKRW